MFQTVKAAPPDPILGLTDAFNQEPNPKKINLGVGVYKDDQGKTPTFTAIRKAEQLLVAKDPSKSYLPISGSPAYAACVQNLVLGKGSRAVAEKRVQTAHCPGGTGALRVAGDFLHQAFPEAKLWVSKPTWVNHFGVFRAAGMQVEEYAYYDAATHGVDFEGLKASLRSAKAGDAILLHGCCHNPTGADPTLAEWRILSDLMKEKGLLPLFDLAYQGLGDGLEEDVAGVRAFVEAGHELLIASSFSKNFGLYNQRVGALTLVTETAKSADDSFSQIKSTIRSNYSNPPAHGGALITTVLEDEALTREWRTELDGMRQRIHQMRTEFVAKLKALGVAQDFSFIAKQRGMFSFSGLTPEQVQALRDRHAIYAVSSGRINVAGITSENIDPLCRAIADVLKG
ncbi:MAG: amino acid aminotransferase [Polyangiaceae bacterium]|nr:amino acid aminotransferase [Polyangiaceae bacterium]